MSELQDLYQEVILDHNKKPRNFKVIADSDLSAEGYNPLCGDHFTVYANLDEQGAIQDIGFQGNGCAISKSSASIMTTCVKGKSKEEAERIFDVFHKMVTGQMSPEQAEATGRLAVFAGVAEFPARVKCASLAWHTLKAALDKKNAVSTE